MRQENTERIDALPHRMTLGDWRDYHTDRLNKTLRHIAERGEDAGSCELKELFHDCEAQIKEALTYDGHRIFRNAEDEAWNVEYPGSGLMMNFLDGKTPYCHSTFEDALSHVVLHPKHPREQRPAPVPLSEWDGPRYRKETL